MRNSVLTLIALAATLVGAPAARADFTIDVSVDVNNLAPEVDQVGAECQVCTGTCTGSNSIAFGSGMRPFPPGPHTYKGIVSVLALSTKKPPVDNTATDFLCTLMLHGPGSNAYGTAPAAPTKPWTQPQPGAAFAKEIRGKVPH